MGLGMDTSQPGRGEAGMGAQARGAQIFLLPSRGRSDGPRREPWFKRPGLQSRSAAVLSLASDSASLRPSIAPPHIFAHVTCFTVWGRSWCSQYPCPTPWLGLCHLSTTLRPLRPPLHRLSAKKLEAASPIIGSPEAPRPKRQQRFQPGGSRAWG